MFLFPRGPQVWLPPAAGPAAPPTLGRSPQGHQLPMLPLPPPCDGGSGGGGGGSRERGRRWGEGDEGDRNGRRRRTGSAAVFGPVADSEGAPAHVVAGAVAEVTVAGRGKGRRWGR